MMRSELGQQSGLQEPEEQGRDTMEEKRQKWEVDCVCVLRKRKESRTIAGFQLGDSKGEHILKEPKKPFVGQLFLFPCKGISHFVIYFLLRIPIFQSNVAAPCLLAIMTNGTSPK